MSQNQNQDYTFKYQINSGLVNLVNYEKRKQLIEEGSLVGLNLYSPDKDASIVTLINQSRQFITPDELNEFVNGPFPPTQPTQPTATAPEPPTNLSATPGNTFALISFTAGSDGGSPITNYEYSTNAGVNYIALSPPDITSPVTITSLSTDGVTPLTNGTTYMIRLKAVNAIGQSLGSSPVSATPSTLPSPPTGLSGTAGDQEATIYFTAGSDGGSPITNYQYSTDNGSTFRTFSPADTLSPVTITTLSSDGTTLLINGTPYTIRLKAVNANGESSASASVSVTPSTIPDAPTGLSGASGNQQVIITFTPGFDGGSSITNYQYSTDDGTTFRAFSPSITTSPVTITTLSSDGTTPLTNGIFYTIKLKAINGNGASISSLSVTIAAGGQALWATYLDAIGSDIGYSVAVDSLNNIYITGTYISTEVITLKNASGTGQADSSITLPVTSSSAAFLIKYDSNGIAQWATSLDGTANDIGYSVAVDSSNNVYITGQYISTGIVTLKNASGTGQADSSITLPATSSTSAFLIKYDSNGIAQWATYLDGIVVASGFDIGYSVALDSLNNIYITGRYTSINPITLKNASGNTQVDSSITLPSVSNAAFLIKYNFNGLAQWATYLDGTSVDIGYSVAVDSSNNIYITGQYTSSSIVTLKNASVTGQSDSSITLPVTSSSAVFLVKYDSNGLAQWATSLDGTSLDIGYSVAVDSSNNLYITGQYISSSIVTLKDASGNGQSNSLITLPATSGSSVFLIKYNSNGVAQWATYLNGTSSDIGRFIKIDSSNNIYITGQYNSVENVSLKNASGNSQTDSSIMLPSTSFISVFLAKYDSNGIAQYATFLDGDGTNIGYSIAIDSSNNIYITGTYNSSGSITLKNASGNAQTDSSVTLPSALNSNVFLMKYTP